MQAITVRYKKNGDRFYGISGGSGIHCGVRYHATWQVLGPAQGPRRVRTVEASGVIGANGEALVWSGAVSLRMLRQIESDWENRDGAA